MTPYEIELALDRLESAMRNNRLGLTKPELRRLQRAQHKLIKALIAAHERVADKALSETQP